MNRLYALAAIGLIVGTAVLAAENKELPKPEAPKEAPAANKNPALPAMATVASFPALYTVNNEDWVSFTVRMGDQFRVLNVKAKNEPFVMYVRPNDILNLVLQKNDDQFWILGMHWIDTNGAAVDVETEESDTITSLDKTSDKRTAILKTRKGHTYHVDKKLATFGFHDGKRAVEVCWLDHLRTGQVVEMSYIQRGDTRWGVEATLVTWGGKKKLRSNHGDQPIVTRIWKTRFGPDGRRANDWWYYVQTDHPKIRYEVDARWNSDVRLQKVGQPPLWHKNKEPSPYSELAALSGPSGPGTVINVAVEGDTVSNSLNGSIASTNTVSGVNSNSNSNSNVSTNVNSNQNSNANSNSNSNENQNQNQNSNQNANSNENSNQNENNNDLRNSLRNSVRNGSGRR